MRNQVKVRVLAAVLFSGVAAVGWSGSAFAAGGGQGGGGHYATPPGPATQAANRLADEELRDRVQAALHSNPYFYDEHVTVSVEHGDVVLHGFVGGAWDLLDAIRIAGNAAGNRRVIDDLEILMGGGKK
jgi:osmotically-inducible protein OsmY